MTHYPPNQLRKMADDLAHDLGGDGMYSEALRQAADDCERLDWIARNFRTCSLDMGGQHRYGPSAEIGNLRGPTFIEAVDTARTPKEQKK
jgi:hypothetical protein